MGGFYLLFLNGVAGGELREHYSVPRTFTFHVLPSPGVITPSSNHLGVEKVQYELVAKLELFYKGGDHTFGFYALHGTKVHPNVLVKVISEQIKEVFR